ncbi:hypothetical protein EIP91_005433 [Steccherinum ochraceum]|uniref:F-box domain-containing protein n=1 Tax=Steccherinum ochraceum TaxID=92696 RepID=A0A4V2MXW1_9APHY|nr:hypothetical protein EIP91_005433 [Steccherinum ochraceum]
MSDTESLTSGTDKNSSDAPPTTLDQFCEALQDEIDEHLRAVASLRRRLNTVAPISCLPPEILSQIFSIHLKNMDGHFSAMVYPEAAQYRWLAVTHVCHLWRQVALSTPLLWSNILVVPSNPMLMEQFLDRSKKAPLNVKVDVISDKWYPTLQRIAREGGRIEHLSWNGDGSSQQVQALQRCFPVELPLLRSLALHGNPDDESGRYDRPVPLPLYTWSVLSLETLIISRFHIDWASMILPKTLTHLSVSQTDNRPGQPSNVTDLARAIGSLVALAVLNVRDATHLSPSPTAFLPSPPSTFYLPSIKTFDITGPPMSCLYLFDHLILPPTCKIMLVFPDDFLAVNMRQMARSVSPKLAHGLDRKAEELPVSSITISSSNIQFSRSSKSSASPDEKGHLFIVLPDVLFDDGTVFREFFPHLPIHSTSSLMLLHAPYVPHDLEGTLQMLSNVRDLSVIHEGPDSRALHHVLGARPGPVADGARTQPTFLLPRLEHLALFRTFFRREPSERRNKHFVLQLSKSLKQRKNSGHEIKTLAVQSCINVNETDIRQLEEHVVVNWDGKVRIEQEADMDELTESESDTE